MSPEAFTRTPSARVPRRQQRRAGDRAAAPVTRGRIDSPAAPWAPANDDVSIAVGDVCAGIGGFALGAPARWRHMFFSEIDPFASAVLAARFPDTPNLGDLAGLDAADLPPLHVLCGGTPCQAFSSAGAQQGLRDPRGALTLRYQELVHGIQAKAPFQGPGVPVAIWENVARLLHLDGGRPFGTVLAGFLGCDEPLRPADLDVARWPDTGVVAAPKRIVAWAVLDAADFGLPQQRRRLFVVSVRPGDGLCPREILAGTRARAPSPDGRGPDGTLAGPDAAIRAACGIRARVWQRNLIRNGRGAPWPIARTLISQAGTSGRGDQAQLWLVERPDGTAYTRRMMPVEYERLQGLPDGHTRIAYAGREADDCPDAPRYKAVGNSVAVPVVRAIAAAADAALADVIGPSAGSEPARAEITTMGAWPVVDAAPANTDASDRALANVDAQYDAARPAAHVAIPETQRRPAEPAWHAADGAVANPVAREFPDPVGVVDGGRAPPRGSRATVADVAVDEDREAPRVADDVRPAEQVARLLGPGQLDPPQPRARHRQGNADGRPDRAHHLVASAQRERVGQRAAASGRAMVVSEARPPPGPGRPTSAARHRVCARRARAPTGTVDARGRPAAVNSA